MRRGMPFQSTSIHVFASVLPRCYRRHNNAKRTLPGSCCKPPPQHIVHPINTFFVSPRIPSYQCPHHLVAEMTTLPEENHRPRILADTITSSSGVLGRAFDTRTTTAPSRASATAVESVITVNKTVAPTSTLPAGRRRRWRWRRRGRRRSRRRRTR